MENFTNNINRITVEDLLESVCKKTNLTDWGSNSFLTPLRMLVESFDTDNSVKSIQAIYFRNDCIRLLVNRLLAEHYFKNVPEIETIKISKPIFIVGLGRTGSTLLHNLLSLDNLSRAVLYWEMLRPAPILDTEGDESKLRIKLAKEQINAMYSKLPHLKQIHELNAEMPEECHHLLRHTFMSTRFGLHYNVPSYIQWIKSQDFTYPYEYYKKLLKLILWQKPGQHLVLKDPLHLDKLNIILKVFPDACIIWTHRNPLTVMPSLCSMRTYSHGQISQEVIERGVKELAEDTNKALEIRKNYLNKRQFYDVFYEDLIKNPVQVIKDIYMHFDYSYDISFEASILNWLKENPQHKHGKHNYCLEQFGLDEKYIRGCFKGYIDSIKRYDT